MNDWPCDEFIFEHKEDVYLTFYLGRPIRAAEPPRKCPVGSEWVCGGYDYTVTKNVAHGDERKVTMKRSQDK
jgi:hypothetical protein